jgi:hypothetical protein
MAKKKQLDEAMGTMNVGAYMKVSRGPMARPKTLFDISQWEKEGAEEDEESEDFPTLPRTGVWSEHGPPTFREDTDERARLEAMGVAFTPKVAKDYFDPMDADQIAGTALFEAKVSPTAKTRLRAAASGKLKGKRTIEKDVQMYNAAVGGQLIAGALSMDELNGILSAHGIDPKTFKKVGKFEDAPVSAAALREGKTAWSYIKPKYRSEHVGWTKSGEFACPYCGTSIGKNLRGDRPFANASQHLKKAHGKTPADMDKLTEGKQKLHPSMKKHVNAPHFKAHVGDSDDSEPPYHKGKGIQSDAQVSAASLREGEAAAETATEGVAGAVAAAVAAARKAKRAGKAKKEKELKKHPTFAKEEPKKRAALAAKLAKDPKVRDPEALAAYIGRRAAASKGGPKEDAQIGADVLREGELPGASVLREMYGSTETAYEGARTDKKLAKGNIKRALAKGNDALAAKWQAKLDAAEAIIKSHKKSAMASRRSRKKTFKPPTPPSFK